MTPVSVMSSDAHRNVRNIFIYDYCRIQNLLHRYLEVHVQCARVSNLYMQINKAKPTEAKNDKHVHMARICSISVQQTTI